MKNIIAEQIEFLKNLPEMQSVPTDAPHSEFVDWLRLRNEDGQLADFLAQREDGAGATPHQWARLASIGNNRVFDKLPSENRRAITLEIIGQEALDAYVDWLLG